MKARLKLFIGGFLLGDLVAFGLMQSASFHSDSGFLLFFIGMGVIFGAVSALIGPEGMNRMVNFISHVL
jgi:hypothetical protein